jgi:hypothetical protein
VLAQFGGERTSLMLGTAHQNADSAKRLMHWYL